MYERLLKQTERYLEIKGATPVSVKQLWDAMVKEGKKSNFTVPSLMADFECLLEGDKRFEFVAEKSPRAGRSPDLEELLEHDELEKLGFLSSQTVRLRRASLPSLDEEEERHDALDAAISIEDLGDNFPDSALFDDEAVPASREPSRKLPRPMKQSGSAGEKGGPVMKKSVKPGRNIAKNKPPAKKRKK